MLQLMCPNPIDLLMKKVRELKEYLGITELVQQAQKISKSLTLAA